MSTLVLNPLLDAVQDINEFTWADNIDPLVISLTYNTGLMFDFSSLPENITITSMTLDVVSAETLNDAQQGYVNYLNNVNPGNDPQSGDWDGAVFTIDSIVYNAVNIDTLQHIDILSYYNTWKTNLPTATKIVLIFTYDNENPYAVKWYSDNQAIVEKRPTLTINYIEIGKDPRRYDGSIDRK